MAMSGGTLTWSTTSVSLAVGETKTVNYTTTYTDVQSSYFAPLVASVATFTEGTNKIDLTGTAAGTVTIAAGTTVAFEMKTTNALTITVTAPVEDQNFLNERGLAHFWENVDALIDNKISHGDVQTSDIATGAVTNIKIGNGAVTADKIANGAVTSAKLGLTSATLPSITWASGIISGSSGFQGLVYADLVLINNAYVARSTTAWNTSWQNIGTLPEGYRPKTQTIFPAVFTNLDTGNMTGYGRVRFNTSGVIEAKANGTASNSYCCFSGVFCTK